MFISSAPILFSTPATTACRRGTGAVWPDTPIISAADVAVTDDLRQHELRGVARDRKADALRAAMIAVLMPITSPSTIDERPTGVAGIERRIGLDDVLDGAAEI